MPLKIAVAVLSVGQGRNESQDLSILAVDLPIRLLMNSIRCRSQSRRCKQVNDIQSVLCGQETFRCLESVLASRTATAEAPRDSAWERTP